MRYITHNSFHICSSLNDNTAHKTHSPLFIYFAATIWPPSTDSHSCIALLVKQHWGLKKSSKGWNLAEEMHYTRREYDQTYTCPLNNTPYVKQHPLSHSNKVTKHLFLFQTSINKPSGSGVRNKNKQTHCVRAIAVCGNVTTLIQ